MAARLDRRRPFAQDAARCAGQLARLRKHLARLDANLAAEREELARRQTVVEAFANRLSQLRAELDMLPDGKHDDDAPAVVPISAAKAPAAGPAQSSVAAKLNTFALAVELRAYARSCTSRRRCWRGAHALKATRAALAGAAAAGGAATVNGWRERCWPYWIAKGPRMPRTCAGAPRIRRAATS